MRPVAACLIVIFLLTASAFAAVDGFVTNKTTGQSASGAEITLLRLAETGESTKIATATTDAQGKFVFDVTLQGIHALETMFDGVRYTQVIPPMLPPNNLQVSVYNATADATAVSIDQHIYFLEPGASQLVVSETFILQNGTQRTYRNPSRGSLSFHLPPEAKDIVQVSFIGPDQRPIRLQASKSGNGGMYRVDEPVPPGESRIDLSYVVPYEGGAGPFVTRNVSPKATTRIVAPPGVTVEGEGLLSLGTEPRTQSQIFGVSGETIELRLAGSGAINEVTAEGGEGQSPQIQSALPPVYDNIRLIIVAGALALLFALILLYRRGGKAREAEGKHAS